MAKTRVEKNKKLYDELEEEMKNSKEKNYEEKLKSIDPKLNDNDTNVASNKEVKVSKKVDSKGTSVLTSIAREVNGQKTNENKLVVVKEEKKVKKAKVEEKEEEFTDPVSFTDKLSVEEILRAKIEQQQRIKESKKNLKRGPTDESYTPEMMQERIKQDEGVDVRKEVKIQTKDYKGVALGLLVIALIAVIVIGALLIFKVIDF